MQSRGVEETSKETVEKTGPKVIVVGSGHGLRVHLPALQATGFDVVALVGRDPERTQRRADKHEIPLAFTDLAEAIRATGAQAVSVASTPANHGAQVKVAIEHGCHVMCEKPFAANAEEAQRLLQAAKDGVRSLPIADDLKLQVMAPSDDPRKRYLHVELPPTLKLFAAWRNAIEQGVSVAPFASFHDGLAAMRVIDAIRASAAAGGEQVRI